MAKPACRKTNAPSGQRTVSEHRRARNQKARGTHDSRRNLLNRDADTEISRTPEDIDQGEGYNDLPSAGWRSNAHGIRWETQNYNRTGRIDDSGKDTASQFAEKLSDSTGR